jgi:hypothetical protein
LTLKAFDEKLAVVAFSDSKLFDPAIQPLQYILEMTLSSSEDTLKCQKCKSIMERYFISFGYLGSFKLKQNSSQFNLRLGNTALISNVFPILSFALDQQKGKIQ